MRKVSEQAFGTLCEVKFHVLMKVLINDLSTGIKIAFQLLEQLSARLDWKLWCQTWFPTEAAKNIVDQLPMELALVPATDNVQRQSESILRYLDRARTHFAGRLWHWVSFDGCKVGTRSVLLGGLVH